MITKEQAVSLQYRQELHVGHCNRTVGPKGGVTETIIKVRVNGEVKTWKKNPTRFLVPIKHGLYEYGYIHERNAHDFHLPKDCPLEVK